MLVLVLGVLATLTVGYSFVCRPSMLVGVFAPICASERECALRCRLI